MENPTTSSIKVMDVGSEKVSDKPETIEEPTVKTEIVETQVETIKKPITAIAPKGIALPFSPFSVGGKPTANQTIKIYHIPAANGSGASKPPIIKTIKLEKGAKFPQNPKFNILRKAQPKEIKPKPGPNETASASEIAAKILLKPQLKGVTKPQIAKPQALTKPQGTTLTPAKKKKELKLLNQSMPAEPQEQRPPPSITADKYCWYSKYIRVYF